MNEAHIGKMGAVMHIYFLKSRKTHKRDQKLWYLQRDIPVTSCVGLIQFFVAIWNFALYLLIAGLELISLVINVFCVGLTLCARPTPELISFPVS